MLLVKSKLRQRLLIYSFSHTDKSYYVRELADLIKEDAGNLSKELKKLEKEGLYKSFLKGKIKMKDVFLPHCFLLLSMKTSTVSYLHCKYIVIISQGNLLNLLINRIFS